MAAEAATTGPSKAQNGPTRVGMMNRTRLSRVLQLVGILAVAGLMIAVTWFATFAITRAQRAAAEARIEARMANEAATYDTQVEADLLEVDQTLRVLARTWETNPDTFHLEPWRSSLLRLNEISPDVFIVDEHGVIRDGTIPELIGSDVRDSDYFRTLAERIFDDGRMYISPSTLGTPARQWQISLARPLHHRDGAFAGVIVAGLRVYVLGDFYRTANIGTHGIIGMVGLEQGRLRFAFGPNPVDPGSSIAASDMFKAMRANPDSVWVGRTALDGIERIHGFHRLADRELAVLVGVDRTEAMQATNDWAMIAWLFAGGITFLLLMIAAVVLRAMRGAHRRDALLGHERAVLASANSELELAKGRADDKTVRLQATLAGMSDGVAMIDGNMHLVEWNPRFPELARVPATMLRVGLPVEDILRTQAETGVFGQVDIEAEVAQRLAALRTGNYADTIERTRPDGRVVELRRNRLPDGGFVTLFTDITERRQSVNALREANALADAATKAMSRFVAIVSHEIRTPLDTLLNSLRLLADSGIAGTQRVPLDMAHRAGEALLALMNDILEMSRLEVGQFALRPGRFALRPLIESTVEMFGAQAAERHIELRTSIAPDIPDELYADAGRVRQVLINLLSNAVKFAAPGDVQITARLQTQGRERRIRLAVRDRGPVIPESRRPQLFEPFSRLDDGGGAAPLGSGLGLTISRHLVARMGGDIGCAVWTDGDQEAGNEFWLTLPVRPAPSEALVVPARLDTQTTHQLPRTRILLVEDVVANQLLTAMPLRRMGHLVDVVSNGPEAVSAATTRPYDLILMDVFIPGMSGLDVTRRIRSLGGPASTVPILALTANADAEDQSACAAAGMNETLSKPVMLAELLDAIGRHVWPHRSDRLPMPSTTPPREREELPALSPTRLGELRATIPADTLASLVEECLYDMSERLALLVSAAQRHDAAQTVEQAHAMAGMSAEYGMAALESRLRALIRSVRQDPDSTGVLAEELEAELFRAAAALRETFRIEMV